MFEKMKLKRFISILLCLAMLVGFIPDGILQVQAETVYYNDFYLTYLDGDTEKSWSYTPEGEPEPLPEGVSYSLESDTLTVTLNNANLTQLTLRDWGNVAVKFVIEGTNTIRHTGTGEALRIDCCPDTTITGSGTLNLYSEDEPFYWHDFYAQPDENGNIIENPDGNLTISGITLNAVSDHSNWSLDRERTAWDCNPLLFMGGSVQITDGAAITAQGMGPVIAETKLTVENASIVAPGLNVSVREKVDSADPADSISSLTLNSGTIHLQYPDDCGYNTVLLGIDTHCRLALNGGTLTLDNSNSQVFRTVFHMGSTSGEWNDPAEATITGGTLDVKMGSSGYAGIAMSKSTKFIQSGGDVTISVPYGIGLDVGELASLNLSGGSLQITGTDNVPADGSQKTGLHIFRGSEAVISSAANLTCSGALDAHISNDGAMLISGGTVTATGAGDNEGLFAVNQAASLKILSGNIHAQVLNPRWGGSVHILGGSTTTDYLAAQEGYILFSGGELSAQKQVHILGDPAVCLSYSEGICAVDTSGTEMQLLTDDGGFWYTDDQIAPITVKHQNAAAATGSVLLEMLNATKLTMGTTEYLRMAVSVAGSAQETAEITLPEGIFLVDNSVSVNGTVTTDYTYADGALNVPVRNGDVVCFAISADQAGEKTVKAQVSGASATLDISVQAYTLSLPNAVNSDSVPVSGTAAPGAVLEFFVDGTSVKTVTANAMGMWSVDLPLEQGAKTYQIHAAMTIDNQSVTTPVENVICNASVPVVESLTFTNTIHGDTPMDPNRDVSVTIDYKKGTRSQNYYTYWPELPDFSFQVKFENNSGTPETVCDVNVVATDYFGVEEYVPTTYDPESGLWVGKAQFCGTGNIVPEGFRVEWRRAGTSNGTSDDPQTTPPLDELEPLIPEAVEENHSTTGIVTAQSNTYTFDLSADASGLQVSDSSGNPVQVSDNCFTGTAGQTYYAELSSGTFHGFDTEKLCILMPATGESSFQYADGVYETKQDGLKVGDIYIDGDAAYKITAVNADGSYQTDIPGLQEVFESLNMDGMRLPEDGEAVILEEGFEDEAMAAFLDSDVYSAYMTALDTYALEEGVSQEAVPELSFGVTVGDGQEYQGKILLPISIKYELISHMTAELPVVGTVNTDVYSEFEYRYDFLVDVRVKMDMLTFQNLVFAVEENHTLRMDFGVKINDEQDDEKTSSLELFFNDALEDAQEEEYLEGFEEEPTSETKTFPLQHLKIRTSIPVVWIDLDLDLEFVHAFSGDMTLGSETTFGQKYGVTVNSQGKCDLFYEPKPINITVSPTFHMNASASFYLKAACGPNLLNMLKLKLVGRAGPTVKMAGHGEAVLSYDPAMNKVEGTFWAGVTMDLKLDLTGELWLGQTHTYNYNLFSSSTPIAFGGSDVMPTRFTVREEEPVQVYDGCDLMEVIDLSVDYQRFSNGLQTASKVMPEKDYSFCADYSGLFSVDGSTLKIQDPSKEIKDNKWIMVTYKSKEGGYEIKKQVQIEYHPTQIRISKSTDKGGPLTAGFTVKGDDGFQKLVSTTAGGMVVVPVEPNKTYTVMEVSCPGGYYCTNPVKTVTMGEDVQTVHFHNTKIEEPEEFKTQDVPIESGGDPSGYVYEGTQSNRLSGVTATVYRSDDPDGDGAVAWDAASYDQINPQTTDVLGQYLWMVPSGYYQVRWSKDGYTSAESPWMVVPPIRTNVNQNLVSTEPAKMSASFSQEMGCIVLRFSKPVQIGALNQNIQIQLGEEFLGFNLTSADADWSVTERPEDSSLCATTFQVWLHKEAVYKETVTISAKSLTYAGAEASHTARVQVTTAAGGNAHYVEVIDGTGSGSYEAGTSVNVSAQVPEGWIFEQWITDGVTLTDDTASNSSFIMPNQNVILQAIFRPIPPTYLLSVTGGSGSGDYESGQLVRVEAAEPQYGKVFEKWEATGISLSETQRSSSVLGFEMPEGTVTLKALYRDKPETYSLEVTNGYGFGWYEAGANVDVTAYPAASGMYFHHWTAQGLSLSEETLCTSSITFAMPANAVKLEPVYKALPELTVTGGTILAPNISGAYLPGTHITVSAAVPETMQFASWSAQGIALTQEQMLSQTITFPMPEENVSLSATFTEIPVPHTLTVTGGTGSGSYVAGTEVSVTATIPEGKEFDRWEVTGITLTEAQQHSAAILLVMPDHDVSLTAVLKDIPVLYTLTVAGGSITGPDNTGSYCAGTEITIAADVPEGMLFDYWTAQGITLTEQQKHAQSITITMPEKAVSLEAVCKEQPVLYTVTVAGGTGSGSYEQNTQVTVTAQVPEGMVFHQWTAQGIALEDASASSITISMPAQPVVLAASYLPKDPAWQLNIIGGSGSGAYQAGIQIPIQADIPEGMEFAGWSADGISLENANAEAFNIHMPQNNVTLTASFREAAAETSHTVVMAGGSGSGTYEPGKKVTAEADVPEGMEFDHWEAENISLEDPAAESITFTAPAEGQGTLTAVFKAKKAGHLLTVAGGSGTGIYQANEPLQVSAEIPVGMTFQGWTAQGITLDNPAVETQSFTMPDNAVTLTAAYQPDPALGLRYSLSVSGGTGSGSYPAGQQVTITPDVPEGKVFSCWTAIGISLADTTQNPLTITMPAGPVQLTAVLENAPPPVRYPLSVTGGTVTAPDASGSYPQGTQITVKAETRENYDFQGWIASGIVLENPSASEITFPMPANQVTLTASYSPKPAEHKLMVVNGTILSPDASGSYPAGTQITVKAEQKENQIFKGWVSQDLVLTDPLSEELLFEMPDKPVTLVATYDSIPTSYRLQVTGGTITVPDASGSYAAGTDITVKADVPEGHTFAKWNSAGVTLADNTKQEVQFTMPEGDVSLTAEFQKNPQPEPGSYRLTVTNGYGSGTYRAGTVVTVRAAAIPGYTFLKWNISGLSVSSKNVKKITFTMPENDVAFEATYTKNPASETPDSRPSTSGSSNSSGQSSSVSSAYQLTVIGGSGSGRYQKGARVRVTAKVPEGKYFDRWMTTGVQLTDPYSQTIAFYMPGNAATLEAIFRDTIPEVQQETTPKEPSETQPLPQQTVLGLENAQPGQDVILKAEEKEGYRFSKWNLSGIHVEDETSEEIRFTMPQGQVSAEPVYEPVPEPVEAASNFLLPAVLVPLAAAAVMILLLVYWKKTKR